MSFFSLSEKSIGEEILLMMPYVILLVARVGERYVL